MGVVVRRYIFPIPTPFVSVLLAAASLLFVHLKKCFFVLLKLYMHFDDYDVKIGRELM